MLTCNFVRNLQMCFHFWKDFFQCVLLVVINERL